MGGKGSGKKPSVWSYTVYKPITLCEVCTKACGKCSWSKYGVQKPVDGWTAIRRDILACGGMTESYLVLDCPEFVLEEHNAWAFARFDPEAIRQKYEEEKNNE